MRYGSVCSGIEAASVAWEALGWMPAWFSEIEAFPSAVLAHHWPHVANLGDMTKIAAAVRAGEVEAPSLLVGGTPCQAFSIAGLRNGLADERGQLTLSYVELANAIDEKRRERGEPESIIVWENVPGVLNSKDNAFGCFLAGLAGESSELQPAGGKWAHAGCVSGPERVIAWRVLDAQFFGVAQRRRRVFVVASARKGFDPAKILFELDSLRRDTPPSRGEGQEIAGTLKARAKSGGWSQDVDMAAGGYMQVVGSHWDNPENPHPTLNQSNNIGGIGQSNQEVFAQRGAGIVGAYRMTAFGEYTDDETASTVKASDYKDATDLAVTYSDVSRTLLAKSNDNMAEDLETYAIHGTQDPDINTDLAHTLGLNHGQENAVIAFSYKDNGTDATNELSPTLRAGNHDSSHANGGQPPAIAYAFAENSRGEVRMQDGDGKITGSLTTGGGKPGQGTPAVAIAGNIIGRTPGNGGNGTGYSEEVGYTLTKTDQHGVVHGMQVRRLTPAECERLQGFPDNHTMIPWRGKDAEDCPDGPRYKAIGNSMAVPVMHWIGKRIQQAVAEAEPLISLSPYSQNLNKLRSRPAHILKEIGDQWRTPDDLWWGMNAKFGPFVLDLFADDHNAKCEAFYTAEDNALTQDWSARLAELGGAAYANPPYSRAQQHNGQYITGMVHIMQHTIAMRELGGRYVYLIKAATSESWWPEDADHIAFIRGRIGFDVPDWFVPADEKQKPSGAFFAGAIAVFDKNWRGPATSYINREELEAMGRMFINQIQRAALRIQGIAA